MAIISKAFSVCITPGGIPPTVHVSEYDVGRSYTVTLLDEDGQAFAVPSGTTAKVEGTIAGHGFSENASVSGSTVTFQLTTNMTAYAGRCWAKIKLTKSGEPVSTCGFILDVDRAGVEAETAIGSDGFEEQIEAAVADYIEENGIVVDDTLSVDGACADAKATGDALNTLRSDVLDSESITIEVPYYTDQIAISKAASSPDAATYGLVNGYTLNSSGNEVAASAASVSGYIPVEIGDVVRIKQLDRSAFDTSTMIVLFEAGESSHSGSGKTVENIIANAAYGSASISGNELTWDTSSISYYTWSHMTVAYLRVASVATEMVLTVNEEIRSGTQTIVTSQPILNPDVKVKEENLDFEVQTNHLSGKKILCIGDSLFGLYHGNDGTPAYVAERTGATVYNCGFGGCRMSVHPTSGYAAFSMFKLANAIATGTWTDQDSEAASGQSYFATHLATLKGITFSSLEFMVIHYGTNDFQGNVTLDNSSNLKDTTTVCGALRYSIEQILGVYPKIHIFVSLPIYRMWSGTGAETYTNSGGKTLPEFVAAIRQVAEDYNLPVIDGYHELGMNKLNLSTFSSDGTHLTTAAGRKRFGYLIGGTIEAKA